MERSRRPGTLLALLGAALPALLIGASPARPDEVVLENGDRIHGQVVRMVEGRLVVRTDYADEVRIAKRRVRELTVDEPVDVKLRSGEMLKGRLYTTADGRWRIESNAARPALAVDPSEVEAINPPPPEWHGNAMLAASRQGGAAVSHSVALLGEAVRRGEENRTTIKALFDYEEGGGEVFSRRVYVQVKNDYFYAQKFYAYVDSEQFSDQPQGLNFRTLSGVGAGWQFVERPDLKFRLEAGASYNGESLVSENNLNSVSGQLGAAFDWAPARWVRLGEQITVWPSLTESHVLGRNEAYLAVPLDERWDLRLSSIVDYDSRPPGDRRRADALWLLGLSYRF